MATRKTSAEKAREDAKNDAADGMFGNAFDKIDDLSPTSTSIEEGNADADLQASKEEVETMEKEFEDDETTDSSNIDDNESLKESPRGPPKGPPTGPPGGPPKGPPKGPPTGPPGGPPKGPPTGPPGGPPKGRPTGPPTGTSEVDEPDNESQQSDFSEQEEIETENAEETPTEQPDEDISQEDNNEQAETSQDEILQVEDEIEPESLEIVESEAASLEPEKEENSEIIVEKDVPNRALAAEKEVLSLSNEVASLRKSLAGAADVIEDLESQPMPPAVLSSDIVVPDHLVADLSRLARQLERERLIRANMGSISMLHPGMPGIMISTKANIIISRLNERSLVGGRLGQGAPEESPEDWRILEVLLASTSLDTGGPAACIHMMGPYTTAVSCEKDLILCSPIDEVGKKQLGKIIIVDPDYDNPDDFLRQTAEALKQGGSKCVVIRGHGAYCVGADLDDAWANAAMLEHSMQIVLLARQANLKI